MDIQEALALVTAIAAKFGNGLWTFFSFLAVLSVVVVIHELGHFWVARRNGVKVDQFSVGFGKEELGFGRELFHRIDRHGTRWSIQSLPLGGFVRFADPRFRRRRRTSAQSELFRFKPLHQRTAVIAAGPIANFLLSLLIYVGLFWSNGEPMMLARVSKVLDDSVAAEAGIKPGDVIVSINGRPVTSFRDVKLIVATSTGQMLDFGVDRGGVLLTIAAQPKSALEDDGIGGKVRTGRIGIEIGTAASDQKIKDYSFSGALARSVSEMVFVTQQTFKVIGRIVTLQEPPDQIGGPARMAEMASVKTREGLLPFLSLVAFISLSIGLANLLPIPMLDGGHLVFYAAEAARGKPVNPKIQDIAFRLGFAVLISMFFVANYNDLSIFRRWLGI